MKHAYKVRIARRMRTREESSYQKDSEGYSLHEGLFDSKAWAKRADAIKERVVRRVELSMKKAQARRDASKGATNVVSRAMLRLKERREAAQLARSRRRANYAAKHQQTA